MKTKYKGYELEFISRLSGDGLTLTPVTEMSEYSAKDTFAVLACLSLTKRTYTVSNGSTYVARIKPVQFFKALKEVDSAIKASSTLKELLSKMDIIAVKYNTTVKELLKADSK